MYLEDKVYLADTVLEIMFLENIVLEALDIDKFVNIVHVLVLESSMSLKITRRGTEDAHIDENDQEDNAFEVVNVQVSRMTTNTMTS